MSFTQKILKLISKNSFSKIINISSNAAQLNSPGRAAYAPSKAALISFTKVLSKELGNVKICVNAIAPGLVNTDMMKNTPPKILDEILNSTPLKKAAEPEDVANSALFLASDLSNHITGEIVFVTGGYE
jgi:3-oxoacyl-[acyl-carrier protein] reductase